MYRTYENPFALQDYYDDLCDELDRRISEGADMDDLADLYIEMNAIRQRIAIAWEDNEAEVEGWE